MARALAVVVLAKKKKVKHCHALFGEARVGQSVLHFGKS